MFQARTDNKARLVYGSSPALYYLSLILGVLVFPQDKPFSASIANVLCSSFQFTLLTSSPFQALSLLPPSLGVSLVTNMSSQERALSPMTEPDSGDIRTAGDEACTDEDFLCIIKHLDHAPATSHGLYLDGLQDDFESLEGYQDGGFHPIHLGDFLSPAKRYRVIHKLGHGGFATVWLCRDEEKARYVAIKVIAAGMPSEKSWDLAIAALDSSQPGAEYVVTPLDHFVTKGPNGSHQCIVLPVLGPRVSAHIWEQLEDDPGTTLRRMAWQATQALDFLHRNGICHGGLSIHIKGPGQSLLTAR